jgi:LPXTG-motif cell wall-anchored protein
MKKSVLVFSMITLLFSGAMNNAVGQEQPKPKKDTINMDTQAKPEFYYAVEDEKADAKGGSKTGTGLILIIGGVVVLGGGAAFFFLKKKK